VISRSWYDSYEAVSETEPADTNYQQWMTQQLDALEKALSGPAS
jgi:hypothetical protein